MSDMESFCRGVDAAVEDLPLVGELLGELALGRGMREEAAVAQLGEKRRLERVCPTRDMIS
jgi:hypothetical protein